MSDLTPNVRAIVMDSDLLAFRRRVDLLNNDPLTLDSTVLIVHKDRACYVDSYCYVHPRLIGLDDLKTLHKRKFKTDRWGDIYTALVAALLWGGRNDTGDLGFTIDLRLPFEYGGL